MIMTVLPCLCIKDIREEEVDNSVELIKLNEHQKCMFRKNWSRSIRAPFVLMISLLWMSWLVQDFNLMTIQDCRPIAVSSSHWFESILKYLESHFLCLECMKRHAEHVVVNEPLTSSNGQGIRCVEPNCKNIILTCMFTHFLAFELYI